MPSYPAITVFGRWFHDLSTGHQVSQGRWRSNVVIALQPRGRNGWPLTRPRFRLHPVRSPLLRVSFSLPPATKMFQFAGFPLHYAALLTEGVAPFGDPWITARSRLPKAFRCDAPSFIGTQRQGIHRVLIMSSLATRLKSRGERVTVCDVYSVLIAIDEYYSVNARFSW